MASAPLQTEPLVNAEDAFELEDMEAVNVENSSSEEELPELPFQVKIAVEDGDSEDDDDAGGAAVDDDDGAFDELKLTPKEDSTARIVFKT